MVHQKVPDTWDDHWVDVISVNGRLPSAHVFTAPCVKAAASCVQPSMYCSKKRAIHAHVFVALSSALLLVAWGVPSNNQKASGLLPLPPLKPLMRAPVATCPRSGPAHSSPSSHAPDKTCTVSAELVALVQSRGIGDWHARSHQGTSLTPFSQWRK